MSELIVVGDIFIPISRAYATCVVMSVETEYVYIYSPMSQAPWRRMQRISGDYKEVNHWLYNHRRAT